MEEEGRGGGRREGEGGGGGGIWWACVHEEHGRQVNAWLLTGHIA